MLQQLERLLTVFETVVKTLKSDSQIRIRRHSRSNSYGNIWDVILGFELLLGELAKFKRLITNIPNGEQFQISINLA
jgi:hypothetical protein